MIDHPKTRETIYREIDDKLRNIRSIEYIIHTEEFIEAWDKADATDRVLVTSYIKWLDRQRLKDWIDKYKKLDRKDNDNPTRADLLEEAKRLKIPYYGRLSKDELLMYIRSRANG